MDAALGQAAPAYVVDDRRLQHASELEWLLTNGLGGFAYGAVSGVPTRREHGLLVAALDPPAARHNTLVAIDDKLVLGAGSPAERTHALTPFQFADAHRPPAGPPELRRFERGPFGCRWIYEIDHPAGTVFLEKDLHLFNGRNAISLRYAVRSSGVAIRLELRPLLRLTPLDELPRLQDDSAYIVRTLPNGCIVANGPCGLHLLCRDADFRHHAEIWRNMRHHESRERGEDHDGDLFCPGRFEWITIPAGGTAVLTLAASLDGVLDASPEDDAAARDRETAELVRQAIVLAGGDRLQERDKRAIDRLVRAGRQFVVQRGRRREDGRLGILAGYPTLQEHGRDALIALPGLLLCTARFDDARRLLETYAAHQCNGLVPCKFDGPGGACDYASADTSLWFVHACCAFEAWSGEPMAAELRRACLATIDAYRTGTDFGIGADDDDLIVAGAGDAPLTWMSAARDGRIFTPRRGKPVEINALWHHVLVAMSHSLREDAPAHTGELEALAHRVRLAFQAAFWSNGASGLLYDRLEDDHGVWRPVHETRPNQLLAVSLEHSPLDPHQQHRVLDVVEQELLTPYGLRSLASNQTGYRPRFAGNPTERDIASHHGAVWPWLLGPYAAAVLRVRNRPREARRILQPIIDSLETGCIGQIAQVYDAEPREDGDRHAGGCVAQAWSVAEVLRALADVLRTR